MTSTTTIRPNDTTSTWPSPLPSEAALLTSRARAHAMKRLRRLLATVVVVLSAILALPATAQAYPAPIGPDSGLAPIGPDPTPAAHPSSSGWGLTTVLGVVVVALLAAGIVVLAQRFARQRRDARPTAADA
jgi:hypothetical protein